MMSPTRGSFDTGYHVLQASRLYRGKGGELMCGSTCRRAPSLSAYFSKLDCRALQLCLLNASSAPTSAWTRRYILSMAPYPAVQVILHITLTWTLHRPILRWCLWTLPSGHLY